MAKLTINKICIENIGPFREPQTFDLTVHSERPVILIKALNGSGKTTLLTCLQVALYGYKAINVTRRTEYDQLITGLLRKDTTNNAKIELDLSVEIGATRRNLTLRREWNSQAPAHRELFNVYVQGIEDPTLTEEWDEFINSILPVELVHLFLFDGEKIEALANPEYLPQLLRRATEVFLGLGGIDALATDLKAVERRTGGKKTVSTELDEAQTQVDHYHHQLEQISETIGLLIQRQAQARTDVDKAQDKLDKYSVEAQRSGVEIYAKAAELKAIGKLCKERHLQARADLATALENPVLPLIWLGSLWNQYKDQWHLDNLSQRNALLLEEFAKRDRRILCTLEEKIPGLSRSIAELFSEDLASFNKEHLSTATLLPGGAPEKLTPQIDAARSQLNLANSSLNEAQSELEKAHQIVDQIPAKEQLSEVFETIQKHSLAVSTAEAQLREISVALDDARTAQNHAETRFNAARQRVRLELKDNAFQLKILDAADRAKQTLLIFRKRLLASKAQWLSEMITKEFKQLLRKRNLISKVVVDATTYSVVIEDTSGHSIPMERLSAGERQILAIAVLSALIRERKGRFPVVVDTPLARLDRSHRESLIHHFFAKVSHQVLVLSTDEEVEDSVYYALEQHLNREYALVYDDNIGRSIATANSKQLSLETIP
ncbi:DNA sulfur modification protein DndD [Pseudomonas sp. A-RE-26]|uniref:DNA sulfur modification protein DndD n=1 Tax=Pseudomonas sp. A-RE-26 TaxID=2832402 RepID=UPI001CBF40C8|nr:DNA sulfur modification protein DndD [Pseudomonas sp. A-RE-26]